MIMEKTIESNKTIESDFLISILIFLIFDWCIQMCFL